MARQSEAGRRHACSRGKSRSRGPSGDHTTEMASKAQLGLLLAVCCVLLMAGVQAQKSALTPKAPNFQYFERPKYRYPYYDEKGRGKLLYGYGGSDLYQYKTYSPLEGIH